MPDHLKAAIADVICDMWLQVKMQSEDMLVACFLFTMYVEEGIGGVSGLLGGVV